MAPKILSVEGVRKQFGGLVALNDVFIGVPEKQITIIIGPNGSGKTTLLNVISGVYKPDSGQVIYNGKEITGWPPHKVYDIGIVRTFQIPTLFHKLTVLENLLVAARKHVGENLTKAVFKRTWMKQEEELVEKAFKVMDLLNLSHLWNQQAGLLSGGEMKLVEIGRALMSDPKVILTDEPAGSVNPKLAHNIFKHIISLRDNLRITFLIIEHRLDVAIDYVDYAYALHSGKVIAEGKPDEVLANPNVIESYLGG
ncbi:MAG: ABC transporter ATP-binding protein [Thermoproteota archaeon]